MAINGDNDYEIRDETNQRILHVAAMTQNEGGSAHHVLDVLEHLAKFKLARNLKNPLLADPAHPFRKLFTIQLIDRAGKVFYSGCLQNKWLHPGCSHPECVVEVEDGDTLELVVENTGKEENDSLHLLRGNNHIILPNAEWRRKLDMKMSSEVKEQVQSLCEDTIKVFLTIQSTSFMSLELPELARPIERGKATQTRGQGGGLLLDNWAAVNFRIRYSK